MGKRWGAIIVLCAALAAAAPAAAGPRDTRIVGGNGTSIEEWPWQVAIADPPSSGGDGYDRQFCGGSLIGPTVVLTAAHCVFDPDTGQFLPPEDFSVITGTTTLSAAAPPHEIGAVDLIYPVKGADGEPAPESQTAEGQGEILYDPDATVWDFAVLELASPAPAPAKPIELAEPTDWQAGDEVWVTGWGSILTPAGPYPDDLQETQINIVDDSTCSDPLVYGSEFDPVTMVCAGEYPAGGKDTCAGDSGGPLVIDIGGGTWRLVGDTSWGAACGLPNFPGVYGRVGAEPMRSAVLDAIKLAVPAPPGGGDGPAGDPRSADCAKAKDKLRKAKRKLKAARKALRLAETPKQERIAKRKVAKAKDKKRRARERVAAQC